MAGSAREELISAIAGWLDRRREAFLTAARQKGIPPSVTLMQPVSRIISETSYDTQDVPAEVTPLALPVLAIQLVEAVRVAFPIEDSPAADLLKEYGERCKVWTPVALPRFEDDPARWISDFLLVRTQHDYFAELSSLEAARWDVAESLAGDLLALIEADHIAFVTALPVAGIRFSEDPTELDNIRLRTLTPEELGDMSRSPNDWPLSRRRRRRLSPPFPDFVSERWVLEVRTACNKSVQPRSDFQPQKLVLAFQLLGFEIHGSSFATTWTEPGPSLWRGRQGFRIGRRGETKDCRRQELQRALHLARKIPDGAITSPTDTRQVVLHRFLLGAAEDNSADELIDYVIALEGFLLPEKEGEYRFKFSLFGSWYLASDKDVREAVFKEFQAIYDVRSALVHGGKPEPEPSIKEKARKARELTSRMIVKALEEGWPAHDALKKATLG